jgi:predicted DNA-binding antitoxin AbrB/MazE fold protein
MKTTNRIKLTLEEGIKLLIQGETIIVPDEFKQQVKERLREIKKHCRTVLSQLNDKN